MLIGIDIIERKRMKLKQSFITKFLNEQEYAEYLKIINKSRKLDFLTGRWAAKEAVIKATNQKITMREITISYDGVKPIATIKNGIILDVSIAHEKHVTVAIATQRKE